MSSDPAAFVRALADAVVGGEELPVAAATLRAALEAVLRTRKSIVLDVQFTGFSVRGQPVGGVAPEIVRAAGQLIVRRVGRIGFTADASEASLHDILVALRTAPTQLGEGGVVGVLHASAPAGVYLTTNAGETYRPAATPPREGTEPASPAGAAATSEPAAETEPDAAAFNLEEFEVLDAFSAPLTPAEPAPAQPTQPSAPEPAGGELFHFFRTSAHGEPEPEADALPEMLRICESLSRFEELAQTAARAAISLVHGYDTARALLLLEALAAEAGRADRGRIFRETAQQALQRAGTDALLPALVEHIEASTADRPRIARFFQFRGDAALDALEALLFRTADPELRAFLFRLLASDPTRAPTLLQRAMGDPSPARTRLLLALAPTEAPDAEIAAQWLAAAARHADASVRADATQLASVGGGRAMLRLLVDLSADREPTVRKAAVQGMGTTRDAAAVPFLLRTLNSSDAEEDLQLAAVDALAEIGSAEAVPPLLSVLGRRQLFASRKLQRLKQAALGALARVEAPAARDALRAAAESKDGAVAAEARRLLEGA